MRDVGVQRVGRLEHQRAPTRAAVGEQQRLEHLVRAVRAEHPLGAAGRARAASARAESVGRAVRVAVERDLARARRATPSTNSGGGGYGLSFVLSRTVDVELGRVVARRARVDVGTRLRAGVTTAPTRERRPSGRARRVPRRRRATRRAGATRRSAASSSVDDVDVLAEVVDAQRAREACGARGREHVVHARDVVADRRPAPTRPQNTAPALRTTRDERLGIASVTQLEVLGCDRVRRRPAPLGAVDEHRAPAVASVDSISARRGASASRRGDGVDRPRRRRASLHVTRTRRAAGAVLGLRQRGRPRPAPDRRVVVGDHDDLRRPGEDSMPDDAGDLALRQPSRRRCPGPTITSTAPDRLGAVGHRGDGLRAADAVHLVDAGERGRGERGRRRTRRRGPGGTHSTTSADPGDARRDRGHQHGRRIRRPDRRARSSRRGRPARLRSRRRTPSRSRSTSGTSCASWYARISPARVLERGRGRLRASASSAAFDLAGRRRGARRCRSRRSAR